MLSISHISKTFNPGTVNAKKALDDLSLTVQDGEFITIIGANGAGKSTLFNAISGSFITDSGRILLDDLDMTLLPEYKRAKQIGRLFQDPMRGTAADMQIDENLAFAARRGQSRTLRWGITKAEHEQYREALEGATGKKVKESYLFLFDIGKFVGM